MALERRNRRTSWHSPVRLVWLPHGEIRNSDLIGFGNRIFDIEVFCVEGKNLGSSFQSELPMLFLSNGRVNSHTDAIGIVCFHIVVFTDDVSHQIGTHDRCTIEFGHFPLFILRQFAFRFDWLESTRIASDLRRTDPINIPCWRSLEDLSRWSTWYRRWPWNWVRPNREMLVDNPLARSTAWSSLIGDQRSELLRIVCSPRIELRSRRVTCIYSDRNPASEYWFPRQRSTPVGNHPSRKTNRRGLIEQHSPFGVLTSTDCLKVTFNRSVSWSKSTTPCNSKREERS